MKYLWTLIPLILATTAVAETPRSGSSEPMPEVAYMDEETDTYPSWVRADRVLDAGGSIDETLFQSPDVRAIQEIIDTHPKGKTCMALDKYFLVEGSDRMVSFEKTVHESDWIFMGRITGQVGGFSQHQPGTLFRIEPEKILKGPEERTFAHFFFLPAGNFSIEGLALCVKDRVYTALPEVGDQVLLTIKLDWFNRDRFLWNVSDHNIYIQNSSEKARFSPRVTYSDKWLESQEFDPLAVVESILERDL